MQLRIKSILSVHRPLICYQDSIKSVYRPFGCRFVFVRQISDLHLVNLRMIDLELKKLLGNFQIENESSSSLLLSEMAFISIPIKSAKCAEM